MRYTLLILPLLLVSGCAIGLGQGQLLSDERILQETARALSLEPSDITISDRETSGVNTYYTVTTIDGRELNCLLNGGNILSLGLTNPPLCAKPGETLKLPGMR